MRRREAALAVSGGGGPASTAPWPRRGRTPSLPYLATSLNNLANMLSALGHREAALAGAGGGHAALYPRPGRDAAGRLHPRLSQSLNNLANMLSDLGRWEAALAAAEEAVRLHRALAEARPDAFRLEFARSLWVAGDLYAEKGDYDDGMAALGRASLL